MKNWNQGEEKPAECEDWKPKGEVVRVARAKQNNNSGKRHFYVPLPFFFFLPATAGHEKNLHGGRVQAPFSQTEPLFRAPDVYLRAAIKQWLFAGLARAGSRTASSLWENTLPHRLAPPPPALNTSSVFPWRRAKPHPPPHSRPRRDCRRRGSAARSIIL